MAFLFAALKPNAAECLAYFCMCVGWQTAWVCINTPRSKAERKPDPAEWGSESGYTKRQREQRLRLHLPCWFVKEGIINSFSLGTRAGQEPWQKKSNPSAHSFFQEDAGNMNYIYKLKKLFHNIPELVRFWRTNQRVFKGTAYLSFKAYSIFLSTVGWMYKSFCSQIWRWNHLQTMELVKFSIFEVSCLPY